MIPEVKLAYYPKSDWEKLMKSLVDRDSMHDTWEEWNQGFVVHDMIIDIDALNRYCLERGLRNDGATRSQYTSQLPLADKKKK